MSPIISLFIVTGPRRLRSAQSWSGWLSLKRRNLQSVRDEVFLFCISSPCCSIMGCDLSTISVDYLIPYPCYWCLGKETSLTHVENNCPRRCWYQSNSHPLSCSALISCALTICNRQIIFPSFFHLQCNSWTLRGSSLYMKNMGKFCWVPRCFIFVVFVLFYIWHL